MTGVTSAVNVTVPGIQNVVGPPAVITGVTGGVFVTAMLFDGIE